MNKLQLAGVLAAASAATMLHAQDPSQSQSSSSQSASMQSSSKQSAAAQQNFKYSDQLRTSKLLQTEVTSPDGQAVGKVEDLVFDRQGKLTHAIVAHGGTLGVGQKLTAVPWQVLSTRLAGDKLVMEQSQLKQAPSFDSNKWPDLTQPNWSQAHDQYWKQAAKQMRTASAPEQSGSSTEQSGSPGSMSSSSSSDTSGSMSSSGSMDSSGSMESSPSSQADPSQQSAPSRSSSTSPSQETTQPESETPPPQQ